MNIWSRCKQRRLGSRNRCKCAWWKHADRISQDIVNKQTCTQTYNLTRVDCVGLATLWWMTLAVWLSSSGHLSPYSREWKWWAPPPLRSVAACARWVRWGCPGLEGAVRGIPIREMKPRQSSRHLEHEKQQQHQHSALQHNMRGGKLQCW
jgi:hypothetical protein